MYRERYLEIAAKMLGVNVKDIPVEIEERLDDTHNLCERAGGALVSRQVIAHIITSIND